jgi:predicted transcriptional regulator YheO
MHLVIIPSTDCNIKKEGIHTIKLLCINLNNSDLEPIFHEIKVGKGMFIFHTTQHHNDAKFGHFKPL